MGFYTYELSCGCVEVTSTIEKEPKTFTLTYCIKHKPFEFKTVELKTNETEKSKKSERRVLNSNGDTS
jgi:hypothetical protein